MSKTMTRWVVGAALAAAAAVPALAADVGVSVSVGQPGFYGRIDVGNAYPQPVLMYPQPVVIAPGPVAVAQRPIYLHVPPGHAKNWGKHCGRYNACGQRVYFVQDSWYNNVYVPTYRREHQGASWRDNDDRGRGGDRRDHGHGQGYDREHGKGHGHGKGYDHGKDHGHGHGKHDKHGKDHGHGNAHGKGRD